MNPSVAANETGLLWERYKNHNDISAREQLILYYVGLVKYVAGRMAISLPPSVQQDDLISYGIFGLIDAIEKFEPERNIKFETYAIARIRGSVWDGLRSMDWVPYSIRQKAKELEYAYSRLEGKLGRAATDEEICDTLSINKQQFVQLLMETSFTSFLSLDEIWKFDRDGGNSVRVIETIEDENAVDPVSMVMFEERKLALTDAINKLPEREKLVIALYYYEGLTLKEIGKVLGVTESRISQLHTKAVLRLRGRLSRVKKKIFD
ncbi:RNA polymerase sigma factor WhiG [Phosphitispora fastidiosa]|uniref:RNA polymerase sigma factor WhiG n=1 Tax=Phosphitispora fastidiosa TaxID=2837202 RepID=UPI001E2A5FF5|nr:RNA polymerase sigma factor WhiG [Phosphitispora fastidiosa]MBU7008294.1 RNA polymerase sigma factor for flagellar operon FliA [Phosphitispora fastidiosa]